MGSFSIHNRVQSIAGVCECRMIANHPFREIFSLKFTGRARRSIDGGVRSCASILSDDKVLIQTSMFLNTIVALNRRTSRSPKIRSCVLNSQSTLLHSLQMINIEVFALEFSLQHLLTGINNNCTSFLPPIERMPIGGILLNLMTEATLHRVADIEPQFA